MSKSLTGRCAFCDGPSKHRFCRTCIAPFGEWADKREYSITYNRLIGAVGLHPTWPEVASKLPKGHPALPKPDEPPEPSPCRWCGRPVATRHTTCETCRPYANRITRSEGGAPLAIPLPKHHPVKRPPLPEKRCFICAETFTPQRVTAVTCGCEPTDSQSYRIKYRRAYKRTPNGKALAMFYKTKDYRLALGYLLKRDGCTCQLCGKRVNLKVKWPHPKSPTVDHIIPRAHGGTHDLSNLQLTCAACNLSKGARPQGEQLRLIG